MAGFFLLLGAAAPCESPLRGELALPEATLSPALPEPERALLPCGLDLNAADAAALQRLPGVGETLAGRIVAWRGENGPFLSARDLLYVRGIGEKTLDEILKYTEEES